MPSDFGRSRILIPATVFLTVGGLFASLWGVVNDRSMSEVRLRTSLTAEQVADHLKEKLDVCFKLSRELRDELDDGSIQTQAAFERRAGAILRYFPSIHAIDVQTESKGIIWRVPDRSHPAWIIPAPGGKLKNEWRPDFEPGSNSLQVTPTLRFADGSAGIVAYLPLTREDLSVLRISLSSSTIIAESFEGSRRGNFSYIIYDQGEVVHQSEPEQRIPFADYFTSRQFAVANRRWMVGVAPLHSSLESTLNIGTSLVLVCGLLVAACMAYVSAQLLSSQQQLRDNEERLRAVADHIPGVVYSYETTPGKPRELIYLGPGLDRLIGPVKAAAVEARFDTLFDLLHPDDRNRITESADIGAERGETVDCEARLLTDNGSYRWVRSLSRSTIVDRDRTRWHIVLIDLTEHRQTINALRESEERYRALVESSPVGVLIHRDAVLQYVNSAAIRLLGYDRAEELIGQNIFVIIPPALHDVVRQRLANTSTDNRPFHFNDERLLRRDGREIDVEIIASNINFDGHIVRQTLALDTSERRQAERRQRLLMQELDHRVKNNLAAVLALLDQTAASTSDFAEFRAKFVSRIKALARTHEILARNKWAGADLSEIMRLSMAPHLVDQSDRVVVEGPSLVVCPRSALPIGLALHELATNALKYGSLSTPNGRVEIQCTQQNGSVILRWTESGGPSIPEPEAFGTGLRLVRGLVEFELGGNATFDFSARGLICTLSIDAAMLTERP